MSKYVVAIIVFLTAFAIGVSVGLFLLVALNGVHGSDGRWGIWCYSLLSFSLTFLLTYKAFVTTRRFVEQGKHPAFVGFLVVTAAIIVSLVAKSIFLLIGVGVAEFARVNF